MDRNFELWSSKQSYAVSSCSTRGFQILSMSIQQYFKFRDGKHPETQAEQGVGKFEMSYWSSPYGRYRCQRPRQYGRYGDCIIYIVGSTNSNLEKPFTGGMLYLSKSSVEKYAAVVLIRKQVGNIIIPLLCISIFARKLW